MTSSVVEERIEREIWVKRKDVEVRSSETQNHINFDDNKLRKFIRGKVKFNRSDGGAENRVINMNKQQGLSLLSFIV